MQVIGRKVIGFLKSYLKLRLVIIVLVSVIRKVFVIVFSGLFRLFRMVVVNIGSSMLCFRLMWVLLVMVSMLLLSVVSVLLQILISCVRCLVLRFDVVVSVWLEDSVCMVWLVWVLNSSVVNRVSRIVVVVRVQSWVWLMCILFICKVGESGSLNIRGKELNMFSVSVIINIDRVSELIMVMVGFVLSRW